MSRHPQAVQYYYLPQQFVGAQGPRSSVGMRQAYLAATAAPNYVAFPGSNTQDLVTYTPPGSYHAPMTLQEVAQFIQTKVHTSDPYTAYEYPMVLQLQKDLMAWIEMSGRGAM